MAACFEDKAAGFRKHADKLQTWAGQVFESPCQERVAGAHCERVDLTRRFRSPRRYVAVGAPRTRRSSTSLPFIYSVYTPLSSRRMWTSFLHFQREDVLVRTQHQHPELPTGGQLGSWVGAVLKVVMPIPLIVRCYDASAFTCGLQWWSAFTCALLKIT